MVLPVYLFMKVPPRSHESITENKIHTVKNSILREVSLKIDLVNYPIVLAGSQCLIIKL